MITIDTNHNSIKVIKELNKLNYNWWEFSTKDLKTFYIEFKGVKASLTWINWIMYITILDKPFLASERLIEGEIREHLKDIIN